MTDFIEQLGQDKEFGLEIMTAAGIKTIGVMPLNGLQINIFTWFNNGQQIGPIFAYLGCETDVQLMWAYRIKEPRIFQSTLKKALPIIKKTNHTGNLGLRLLISAIDKKAYGIRWQTSMTKDIMDSICSLLKVPFSEWSNGLENGFKDDKTCFDCFHYTYSGSIIKALDDINDKLLVFRAMGYELPFTFEHLRAQE